MGRAGAAPSWDEEPKGPRRPKVSHVMARRTSSFVHEPYSELYFRNMNGSIKVYAYIFPNLWSVMPTD